MNATPTAANRRSAKKYSPGLAGALAAFFKMRDDSTESFVKEFLGGITNYLVCVYVLRLGPILQAGVILDCETSGNNSTTPAGYSCGQLQALPVSYALVAGLSTILMGVIAGVPFTIAPGVSFAGAFQATAIATGSPQVVLACNIIVGLIVVLFGATSKKTKVIHVMPEDYRLGLAAGIGGFLALIGARSMNIVPFGTTAYVTSFSYKTILGLAGVVLIAVIKSLQVRLAAYAFIISIVAITIISVIIRAASNEPILPLDYESGVASLQPLVETLPSFENWNAHDFVIFKYIVQQSVTKLFDLLATITALILLAVVTKLGYTKETFINVLAESDKVMRIYIVEGFCNALVAPLLGVSIVTPFIESAAWIVVGARTGLASVVTGSLFLISCLFAAPIATIIPAEASGGAILVACFYIIQDLKYIDYERTPRAIPALMAFVLVPFTASISVGASFSFVVLIAIWAITPNLVKITPQMVVAFALSVLLLVVETGLVTSTAAMGAVLGGCIASAAILGLILHCCGAQLKDMIGDSFFDVSANSKAGGHGSKGGLESPQSSPASQVSMQLLPLDSPRVASMNLKKKSNAAAMASVAVSAKDVPESTAYESTIPNPTNVAVGDVESGETPSQ